MEFWVFSESLLDLILELKKPSCSNASAYEAINNLIRLNLSKSGKSLLRSTGGLRQSNSNESSELGRL